jgi:3D (Asp-Asp-Asp) domain-containing protein
MPGKKQIITLVIGLILLSSIVLIKLDSSQSEASRSDVKTKAASTEVKQASTAKTNQTNKAETQLVKAQTQSQPTSKSSTAQTAATAKTAQRQENVSRGGYRTITMVASGYTDAPEENYPYAGMPSYIGMPLQRGVVAVDPNVIPMGTKLYVEGYGDAIAADQGGAIKGNRIDLFFNSKSEAYNWGMRTVKVTIIK